MKKKKILDSLVRLLVSFNVAAGFLSLAFNSPRKGFSWRPIIPLNDFINSRDWPAVPWVSLAALALSVGIYLFVRDYLEIQESD